MLLICSANLNDVLVFDSDIKCLVLLCGEVQNDIIVIDVENVTG